MNDNQDGAQQQREDPATAPPWEPPPADPRLIGVIEKGYRPPQSNVWRGWQVTALRQYAAERGMSTEEVDRRVGLAPGARIQTADAGKYWDALDALAAELGFRKPQTLEDLGH